MFPNQPQTTRPAALKEISPRKLRWILSLLVVVVLGRCAHFTYDLYGQMGAFFKGDAMRTLGKTELEAKLIMRIAPSFVLSPAEVRKNGINAPWVGMNFVPVPTYPVHKRVLLYKKGWWAAYIFIDNQGKVEHVGLAST